MKVTQKLGDLLGPPTSPAEMEKEELPPSLHLSHLPKAIEGMPDKGDFHAHIKGKVRAHHIVKKDGKEHHNYDLDVHHCDCEKKAAKKKQPREKTVDEAFDEYGPGHKD